MLARNLYSMSSISKAFIIPNDPAVIKAVREWLERDGLTMVLAYPDLKPPPAPIPDPIPQPAPNPTPLPFAIGTRVRVKPNANIYWDANGSNVKNAPQTRYGDWPVLAISGIRRALMKWRPDGGSDPVRNSDEWANVADLEAI